MLLNSLSIRGLYETLNLDVKFNEDITLLVGINGSGKTSVLNVIDWLLKPSLEKLALIDFTSLTLHFSENAKVYQLLAKKSNRKIILSIHGQEQSVAPITINILPLDQKDEEDAGEHYRSLSPEKHEMPMWNLLKSFSRPKIISLDRTISAEPDDVHYFDGRPFVGRVRARPRSPLNDVQEVTSAKYAEYRAKAIAYDNELKTNIVISALQDPEAFRDKAITPMTPEAITQLEEKVSAYLSATIKSTEVRKQVQKFFKSSRILISGNHRSKNQPLFLYKIVAAQYRQLESLAQAFNDFEEKNSSAFKSLHNYLGAVNRFFNDSGKKLSFDASTGTLVFSIANDKETNQSGMSITHLSSGERQILTLFTFLAFASNPKSVFIVDEPELSLHPKWQSDFMDAFLTLRPEKTQLLLATHSPDIVGKYKNSCVVLRGSRV